MMQPPGCQLGQEICPSDEFQVTPFALTLLKSESTFQVSKCSTCQYRPTKMN